MAIKRKITYLLLPVGLLLTGFLHAQQKNAQLRLGAAADGGITSNLDWGLEVQQRFQVNTKLFDQFLVEPGIAWKPAGFAKIGLGYRLIFLENPQLNTRLKQRLHLDLRLSHKWDEFRPFYRTRLQYGFDDESSFLSYFDNAIVQRHQFGLEYRIFGSRFNPSVAYEFYHHLNKTGGAMVTRHRYLFSSNIKLNRSADLEGFYILGKEVNVAYPETDHIFGLAYKQRF